MATSSPPPPPIANGFYEFTGLTPGDYKVMFVQPGGFSSVSPFQAGNDPTVDSDANPNNGLMSDVVTLESGENNPTIDAGFFNTSGLGDFVWEDLNANGIQDVGDAGIAGAIVKLLDANGNELETTTTDASGFYEFINLTPGDYKVMFVQPNGFDGVSPFQAGNDPAVDSDANPDNGLMSDVVTLDPGEFDPTIDAGFFKFASIGDFVWNDLNANGIQDPNEPGISGAEVKLQDPGGNVLATTTTDANGFYEFTNLTPGDYKVMFVQPGGFSSVSPFQAGNDPTVDSDADPNNGLMSDVVTLQSGENNPTIDAGFFNTSGLGDFVWEDLNANGIQDVGDAGIAGAIVKLLDANGNELETTTTDASGFYEFINLTPGDYKVMFVQPNGFDGVSPFQAGNDPAVDSDANPDNGLMSDVVTLDPGEFDPTIDAGFFKFASIGDFVWNDLNANGIQDPNEPGISGAEVKLQDPGGNVLATTTTDANGFYEFTNLTPGDYKVMFVQPGGFSSVSPFQAGNDPTVDSDADPNNGLMSDVVTLQSGENNPTIDAGFFNTSGLGDFVWEDLNANGIQDVGDAGIAAPSSSSSTPMAMSWRQPPPMPAVSTSSST